MILIDLILFCAGSPKPLERLRDSLIELQASHGSKSAFKDESK